jgi:hypothetical protein
MFSFLFSLSLFSPPPSRPILLTTLISTKNSWKSDAVWHISLPYSCYWNIPRVIYSMHRPTLYLRCILILHFQLCLGLSNGFFPEDFLAKILFRCLIFPMYATCQVHLTDLGLITLIKFHAHYRSCCLSCNFVHHWYFLSLRIKYSP